MWEYAIIPISFSDYNEYVDMLQEYGDDGWIFGAMIHEYKDSPIKGVTTHDFVCRKRKQYPDERKWDFGDRAGQP